MARLLLVEDEAHIASGLSFNLKLEGHELTVAADGLVAQTLLMEEKRTYDLLILDLMLPGMSGLELCRTLRRSGNFTPILMLTAKREESDKVHGLRMGADDYLTKPFNLEELLARVEALLRRRGWQAPPDIADDVLLFGEARLDFSTFEAYFQGQEVKLTPIEFAVMKIFRDSEGKVVTREQLLESAWGWQGPVTTRTVDNFILRLRKALEPEPSTPRHILSVRGAGYKFVK
jgi:DNA-binding response OmpR family regulator